VETSFVALLIFLSLKMNCFHLTKFLMLTAFLNNAKCKKKLTNYYFSSKTHRFLMTKESYCENIFTENIKDY